MRTGWRMCVEQLADLGVLELVQDAPAERGGGVRLVAVSGDEQLGADVGFEPADLPVEVLVVVPEARGGVLDAVVLGGFFEAA